MKKLCEQSKRMSGAVGHPAYIYSHSVRAVSVFILALICSSCEPAHALEGLATYYTSESCSKEAKDLNLKGSYWGAKTASGERYDENALTCAMRRRDWGTEFYVYGHTTGRGTIVKLNDFGPSKKSAKRGTIIDLTPKVFNIVCGNLVYGRCEVSVQEVSK